MSHQQRAGAEKSVRKWKRMTAACHCHESRMNNEQRNNDWSEYCRRFQILYEGVPVSSHLLRVSTIQPSSHHTNELMSTDADHDGCTVRQSLERERWECPYIAIIVECANHVAPGWKRSWSGFHDRYSRGAEDFE